MPSNVNILLQTLTIVLQCLGMLVIVAGFVFVLLQLQAAQRNAMMSSFISGVANHWMSIEERRYRIRSGELKPGYRLLVTTLERWLADRYQGNLKAMAEDLLWENQAEIASYGKKALFDAVGRELALQQLIFNLYEEEYIAGKHLKLVDKELWDYWDFYMRRNFGNEKIRLLWELRKEFGEIYEPFAEFVEKEYLSSPGAERGAMKSDEKLE